MSAMTVTDFRLHPARAIARVEEGEIIEITRNNRTIAELRPRRSVPDSQWNQAAEELTELLQNGIALGGGPYTKTDKYGDVA